MRIRDISTSGVIENDGEGARETIEGREGMQAGKNKLQYKEQLEAKERPDLKFEVEGRGALLEIFLGHWVMT